MALLMQARVRRMVHEQGKQISQEAMNALERGVFTLLSRAIANTGRLARVNAFEVEHATKTLIVAADEASRQ